MPKERINAYPCILNPLHSMSILQCLAVEDEDDQHEYRLTLNEMYPCVSIFDPFVKKPWFSTLENGRDVHREEGEGDDLMKYQQFSHETWPVWSSYSVAIVLGVNQLASNREQHVWSFHCEMTTSWSNARYLWEEPKSTTNWNLRPNIWILISVRFTTCFGSIYFAK